MSKWLAISARAGPALRKSQVASAHVAEIRKLNRAGPARDRT